MTTISEAMDDFKGDLVVNKGKSLRTAEAYGTALNLLAEFLAADGLSPTTSDVGELAVDHALRFIPWLVTVHFEGQVRPATKRTYLTGVQAFYKYLLRNRLIEISLADYERLNEEYGASRQVREHRVPRVPAESAVQRLLEAVRSVPPFHGDGPDDRRRELIRLRDIAMVELLRYSGLRVGELVGLRRGDLDYEEATVLVRGKGNRERVVPIGRVALQAIRTYLAARGDGGFVVSAQPNGDGVALHTLPLFARHDRGAGDRVLPLSTNSVQNAFRKHVAAAGLHRRDEEKKITPHSMRHYFGTKMLDETGDLALVQDLLGHASPQTTRVYTEVAMTKKKRAHRKVFGES
jgi:integrase/recombinase XerC